MKSKKKTKWKYQRADKIQVLKLSNRKLKTEMKAQALSIRAEVVAVVIETKEVSVIKRAAEEAEVVGGKKDLLPSAEVDREQVVRVIEDQGTGNQTEAVVVKEVVVTTLAVVAEVEVLITIEDEEDEVVAEAEAEAEVAVAVAEVEVEAGITTVGGEEGIGREVEVEGAEGEAIGQDHIPHRLQVIDPSQHLVAKQKDLQKMRAMKEIIVLKDLNMK